MFERFTDRARKVVVLAGEEAQSLGHSRIGPEHLLLAMVVEEEGIAGTVLLASGLTPYTARQIVTDTYGESSKPTSGHIPFTDRARKVVENALREALMLGHPYIGTEHLLLGFLRLSEAETIVPTASPTASLREDVLRMIGPAEKQGPLEPGPGQLVLTLDEERAWIPTFLAWIEEGGELDFAGKPIPASLERLLADHLSLPDDLWQQQPTDEQVATLKREHPEILEDGANGPVTPWERRLLRGRE